MIDVQQPLRMCPPPGSPCTCACMLALAPLLSRCPGVQHMAELTVRETVDFSRRVQGSGGYGGELPPHQQPGTVMPLQPQHAATL